MDDNFNIFINKRWDLLLNGDGFTNAWHIWIFSEWSLSTGYHCKVSEIVRMLGLVSWLTRLDSPEICSAQPYLISLITFCKYRYMHPKVSPCVRFINTIHNTTNSREQKLDKELIWRPRHFNFNLDLFLVLYWI